MSSTTSLRRRAVVSLTVAALATPILATGGTSSAAANAAAAVAAIKTTAKPRSAVLSWQPIPGAARYTVRFAGASWVKNTTRPKARLTQLKPGSKYRVAITSFTSSDAAGRVAWLTVRTPNHGVKVSRTQARTAAAGQTDTKGDRGDTGPAGPTGATGAKGDTGDRGPSDLWTGTISETVVPSFPNSVDVFDKILPAGKYLVQASLTATNRNDADAEVACNITGSTDSFDATVAPKNGWGTSRASLHVSGAVTLTQSAPVGITCLTIAGGQVVSIRGHWSALQVGNIWQ